MAAINTEKSISLSAIAAEAFANLPLSVEEIQQRAMMDLPAAEQNFKFGPDRYDNDCLRISIAGENFSDTYVWNTADNTIGDGNIKNYKSDRVTGRTMMANRALVGMGLGVEAYTVFASDAMGGYIWARAGFQVMRQDRHALSENLQGRAELLEDCLDEHRLNELLRLCLLKNPDDLYEIAWMNNEIPYDMDLFDRSLARAANFFIEDHNIYESRGWLRGGLTVSKFLLFGESYKATAQFNNAAQMVRFETYTGMAVRDSHLQCASSKNGKSAPVSKNCIYM